MDVVLCLQRAYNMPRCRKQLKLRCIYGSYILLKTSMKWYSLFMTCFITHTQYTGFIESSLNHESFENSCECRTYVYTLNNLILIKLKLPII